MPNALCHLDRANFLMDDTLRLRLRQLTNEDLTLFPRRPEILILIQPS